MKNLSTAFKQALYNDERNYTVYADITLADSTVLNLSNSEIWTGGFSYEEAVSEDNNFTALGSAIIGSATLIINNVYQQYTEYDFTNASVVLSLSMSFEENESTRLEKFKVGTYTVDDTRYNGATITLSLLDNMELFDRPYSISTLTYSATLREIVEDACQCCGVTLKNSSFPYNNLGMTVRPDDDTTFREVISWCALMAGCFAKCDADGKLELKWFDQTTLQNFEIDLDGGTFNPWTSGPLYDGGTFNPWTSGDSYEGGSFVSDSIHHIAILSAQNLGLDDVVITGLSVTIKSENDTSDTVTYNTGTSGYVIQLEENPFFTQTNAQAILDRLGQQLIGLRFRTVNVQHLNNPAIEAGDIAIVIDRKQNVYPILVTRTSFSVDGYQTTVCGASTPSRNSATRFSSQTKSYVEARKLARKEKTAREQAIQALQQAIASSSGLYYTAEVTQSGSIYYLHDLPQLSQSSVVMKVTSEAVAMTDEYNAAHPELTDWKFGVTVNGTVIANYLSADGIDASWIRSGSLTITDANNNETFYANTSTGEVRINASVFRTTLGGPNNNGYLRINNAENKLLTLINRDGALFGDPATSEYVNIIEGILVFGHDDYLYPPYTTASKYTTVSIGLQDITSDQELSNGPSWATGSDQAFILNQERSGWDIIIRGAGAVNGRRVGIEVGAYQINANGSLYLNGELYVKLNKGRIVENTQYGSPTLYCYETPTPYFGDIGTSQTDENGEAFVSIDDIFDETVDTSIEYNVFLQKEGQGDIWVDTKDSAYFIVKGTPNLKFSWEVKAVQKGFEQLRLDDDTLRQAGEVPIDDLDKLLDEEFAEYDKELEEL